MSRKYDRAPAATELEKWKRALADHNRQQRTRRARIRAPQITGVVVKPAPKRQTDPSGTTGTSRE